MTQEIQGSQEAGNMLNVELGLQALKLRYEVYFFNLGFQIINDFYVETFKVHLRTETLSKENVEKIWVHRGSLH